MVAFDPRWSLAFIALNREWIQTHFEIEQADRDQLGRYEELILAPGGENLSNTVLAPAIGLYRNHGFETTHLGSHPDYQRCNIVMALQL